MFITHWKQVSPAFFKNLDYESTSPNFDYFLGKIKFGREKKVTFTKTIEMGCLSGYFPAVFSLRQKGENGLFSPLDKVGKSTFYFFLRWCFTFYFFPPLTTGFCYHWFIIKVFRL
jgi:hypothetical protein